MPRLFILVTLLVQIAHSINNIDLLGVGQLDVQLWSADWADFKLIINAPHYQAQAPVSYWF